MLLNEAKVYTAFPRNLQDGVAPIVPKFCGYYAPSTEAFDLDDRNNGGGNSLDEGTWKIVRKYLLDFIPPTLLMEESVPAIYLTETGGHAIFIRLPRSWIE
jgi:hypothetical protein